MTPPEGFKSHFRKSPLTDPWEPLYSKQLGAVIVLGLYADEQHCNSRGLIHGGLISALADNAMGLSCAARHEDVSGLVTITLHVDFVDAGKLGDWLTFETTHVSAGKTIDTAQGRVLADGKIIALTSATFRVFTKRD